MKRKDNSKSNYGVDGNDAKITTICGMTLKKLRDKYRAELFSNFIPNMDKYSIDHEYGGVMTNLNLHTGELINTNKTSWYVGRGGWIYSFLYNNLEQNPRYLEIAHKSIELLMKLQPTDDSFWTKTFTREGKPIDGPGDIYGSLFVAEAAFEYAKASGETKYREIARKIIFDCVARYDRPDYTYNVTYFPGTPPPIQGPRVLGHWMLFLSLSTQMLKHEPDVDLEKLASRSVEAILKHHVNVEYGLTNEVLNHDFSLPTGYSQFSIPGHGLETLTFVMFEAARRKDAELFRIAEPIFKKIVDVAADYVYGGYFTSLHHVDNYTWLTKKELWCQQEVQNGTLFLIEHTGDEWAKQHFDRADAYIYEKFFNPANKFWPFWGDRKMTKASHQMAMLEPYHHARHTMLGLLSIDRMIKREGRISGLFA
jgi:N-acylglucosamine 2-epimerase